MQLENPRHEAFAQAVASGLSAPDAFRKISGKKRAGDREMASRWLTKVDERVSEIQRASDTATTLTMQERREFMARVARVDMMTFDPEKDGDLVQEIIRDEKGTKLKIPGKRECIMDDARLAGELIEKTDHTSGGMPIVPLIQINIAPHWGRPRTGAIEAAGRS